MSIRTHCLIALAALAVSFDIASADDSSEESIKQEASKGWIDIVTTYFSQDCDRYRSMFTDRLKVVNPFLDTLIETAPLFEGQAFCDRIGLWTGGLASIEDYCARYDVVVYSVREIMDPSLRASSRDSLVLARSINSGNILRLIAAHPGGLTDDDYLIIGDVGRDPESRGLGSAFTPIIRKTDDGWKISGMLP